MESHGLYRFLVAGTDTDVAEAYASAAGRARDAVFGFEDDVVYVDIETTGFDPDRDAIIEIAAARANGPEILERFHTMVDPGRSVPFEITKLTGIDDSMLEGAPGPEAAAIRLAEFVDGRDIVAHNVAFDRGFLLRAAGAARFRGAWIDSLQLALIGLPRLRSHRLRDLAEAFGAAEPKHRATDDVEALASVYRVALVALSDLPAGLLSRIAALSPTTAWGARQVISHLAAGAKGGAFDLKRMRGDRVSATRGEAMFDAEDVSCTCPSIDEITSEFSADGIAGRMYAGFESRDEQAEMATAVTEAFSDRHHVAIEAGTGVGKSIAYLVPAVKFAMQNRVTVGIATKTNSLADQLVYSELPALSAALAANDEDSSEEDPLRYVSLKGYDHYPCLRKVERLIATLDDAPEHTIVATAALLAWTSQSSWGDLGATNIHWRRDMRGSVTASIADCTRKRCRFFPYLCYLHGARRRACSAHVVVTNHALLFRDVVASGGILPPIRHWIVDEAHSAEAEARDQLSMAASHIDLSAVLGALYATGRGGLLENVRRAATRYTDELGQEVVSDVDAMRESVIAATNLTNSLFDFVKDLEAIAPASAYEALDMRITPQVRESGPWATVQTVGSSLVRKLEAVLQEGRTLFSRLEEVGNEFVDGRADLAGLLSRVAEQREALITVIDGEATEYVFSLTLDRRRNIQSERLTAARLDVGEVLAHEFLPRTQATVFTSATIAAGEDFSHFAHAVGLDRLPERADGSKAWTAVRLDSSYDFERQMAVFVPTDIAAPNMPGYHGDLERTLEQIHRAMGGSTLTLFTNRRDMEAMHRAIEPRLVADGIPLLVQGRGVSAKRLRDEFIADEHLSLFATKSFWEGFDAKGDTLRCVVVPRLPFGRPNDPLAEEREAREGRAAWKRYALPEAILELKQAAGRLIRSTTDTGCLVIADVRVVQKGYGQDFLSALPVQDVEQAPLDEVLGRIGERFGR